MSRRLVALLLALACFGCGGREPRIASTRSSFDGSPQDGGTLVRRLEADVSSLNPILASSRYDRYVAQYLFTPLIHLDRNLTPVPGLAKAWKVSDDGLLFRFELDERATFSDGNPVRAADVLFTLQKIVDPGSEAIQIAPGFELLDQARTRAIDDRTIEVAFRTARAGQLTYFNNLLVLPAHVYSEGDFRDDFRVRAVGSGPYTLAKRTAGVEVVLERRADYWTDKPHIQTVVMRVVSDQNTAWNALRTGEIDETVLAPDLWLRERNNPALSETIEFRRFYTRNYNYIAWNQRHPPLADPRVRRALAMCIPIEAIVRDLYHGTARAMSGPFTPDEWAFNPSVPVIRHDLAGAARLLATAGWTDVDGDGIVERDGQPLNLELMIMSGSTTGRRFAEMLQGEMKQAGVALEISVVDGTAAIDRIVAGNYQAAYLSWDLDPDPDVFPLFHSTQTPPRGSNVVRYSNPEADRLMEQGRSEMSQAKRKEIYWRLHEVLAADQPYAWTAQVSLKWGINKRVRGVAESSGFGLFLWYPGELAWWIAPAGRELDRTSP
ncbi:MAG TPA: ABC transporter substrate-binding protein [Thermoanaerobaculia bacterium]